MKKNEVKEGDYTYTVSQDTSKNSDVDPSVAQALGSYRLLLLLNSTGRLTKDWHKKTATFKFKKDYYYEVEESKYTKMQESFNAATPELKAKDKVYMFGDLKLPSINLTSILKNNDSSRTRDISKADVIVIPHMPPLNPYSTRDQNDILFGSRTTVHKLESDNVNLKDVFEIDNSIDPIIGFSDHVASWWSTQKSIVQKITGDPDLNYYNNVTNAGDTETAYVAAKYMEALYYNVKNGVRVITEDNLDKMYSERTVLNYDNAQTILNLLRSDNHDDITMGATVLAESNYLHEGKAWAHYIFYREGQSLHNIQGNYKNIKTLKNTFDEIYLHPSQMLNKFTTWYPDMDEGLKKLIIQESIESAMYILRTNGYGDQFTKNFDVNIAYAH